MRLSYIPAFIMHHGFMRQTETSCKCDYVIKIIISFDLGFEVIDIAITHYDGGDLTVKYFSLFAKCFYLSKPRQKAA